MVEYAIKNVTLESNLSRRNRYVALLFFALYTAIAFVFVKKENKKHEKEGSNIANHI